MFTKGFNKVAFSMGAAKSARGLSTARTAPKSLGAMTGKPAQNVFGNPVRNFGASGRPRSLMPMSGLRDGLR